MLHLFKTRICLRIPEQCPQLHAHLIMCRFWTQQIMQVNNKCQMEFWFLICADLTIFAFELWNKHWENCFKGNKSSSGHFGHKVFHFWYLGWWNVTGWIHPWIICVKRKYNSRALRPLEHWWTGCKQLHSTEVGKSLQDTFSTELSSNCTDLGPSFGKLFPTKAEEQKKCFVTCKIITSSCRTGRKARFSSCSF